MRGLAIAFGAAVVLGQSLGIAQGVATHEIKAALLFNLAQFVIWPPAMVPAGAPVMLCVLDDPAVAEALARTIDGRTIEGHQLIVKPLKPGGALPTCHVLYLAGDLKRSVAVMATLKGTPIFTVSDAARFAHSGGIVELVRDNARMRLTVNLDALERAGVGLSSRVLTLAKVVRDSP